MLKTASLKAGTQETRWSEYHTDLASLIESHDGRILQESARIQEARRAAAGEMEFR